MCGIAGIIDFRGRPIEPELLHRFCSALAHRGPDDAGIWQAARPGFTVGLAQTRLAVIDPTPEGHQPMTDAAGHCAVAYNGELYNYRDLRRQLPGPFRTQTDTEVVLEACRLWGPASLRRFDAMWALAFVDMDSRSGHLSRDPFGIKPLYYCALHERLIFASELGAVRRVVDAPLDIDPEAIELYLHLGFIPHPLTIYRQIRKLPPGHMLPFDAMGVGEPARYYRLPAPTPPPTYEDACRQLRAKVESAVVRQCVADVPLGAFLSGGLDSSIVVACMARAGMTAVRTFTIGYPVHPRYDETRYAEVAARHFGTRHETFPVGPGDVLAAVEPALTRLGEPFADSSLLPTSLVSCCTRKHVTVALSGDGGDELFAGYWRYRAQFFLERYLRLPRVLRRGLIEPLLSVLPEARSTRLLDRIRQVRKLVRAAGGDAIDRHLAWARTLSPERAAALMGQDRAESSAARLQQIYRAGASALWDRAPGARRSATLEDVLLADLSVGLPADMLFKVDAASMMHSLEVRVPLLATDVAGFVTGLPLDYRITSRGGKRILRDAFRDVLPPELLDRPKMGFEVPVGEFLRNELRDLYAATVTPQRLAHVGIDPAAAAAAYEDHRQTRKDHTELLWSLLVLCHWLGG